MQIKTALTDDEINACYPLMRELRPHLKPESFVSRVREQERTGYRLSYLLAAEGRIAAVTGHRLLQNLAWGRFLYVDDLVTLPGERSKGYGKSLLAWLREYACEQGCEELHLDSGLQRKDAHRFYEREGLAITCYHFAASV